ncbi:MAG: hypothetical protein EXR62_05325 [Chloroflexi bacterium]|nr:hypothetical protein [Chloroflexota bacterium]
MSLSPPIVLSALLSALYASCFHLFWGRHISELGIFALGGIVGFAIGHFIFAGINIGVGWLGEVQVLGGTLGSWSALFMMRFVLLHR